VIDPPAAPARYVLILNTGGHAPPRPTDARPGLFEVVFGKRAFFLYAVAPDGAVWWGAST
jgi:FAD-dependent urate hydroxylase